jgi:predicted lipoprotein
MATTVSVSAKATKTTRRRVIVALVAAGVLGAMAFDTTVVVIGGEKDQRQQAFNPDAFGAQEFPRIRDFVSEKAPDAVQLANELAADRNAAIAAYATMAGAFPVIPVSFTGRAGEGRSGIFQFDVEGLPDGVGIRVQTGPAINGTELRDITGDIVFGDFTNQIEYQNVGAGINRAMASEILSDLDRDTLTGQTVRVTGVFTMVNPQNWLITPVAFEVQ